MNSLDGAKSAESAFGQIWSLSPGERSSYSTLWWIFVLCPKQGGGYGPKQMMWGLFGRGCDRLCINGRWHRGLDVGRARWAPGVVADWGAEKCGMPLAAIGWFHDGSSLHEEVVHAPCEASLSDGHLIAKSRDPSAHGAARISAIRGGRPLAMRARFEGARGTADFEAWADHASPITSPVEDFKQRAAVLRTHAITVRKIQFEGIFSHPGGEERLEGCGYFQRYCLDFPAIAWKWVWTIFDDGSVFSCFVPHTGLRRAFGSSPRSRPGILERAAFEVGLSSGYFCRGGSSDIVGLRRARITLIGEEDGYPRFSVEARSPSGDHIRFTAAPYGASRLLFERPLLRGVASRYCYNEYCFRVERLEGSVGGSAIRPAELGRGFGSCEYTWGIGI